MKLLLNHNFKKYLTIFLTSLFAVLNFSLASNAQGSGYYEVPGDGRPKGVFSTCCCKLENKNDKQSSYSCKYYDDKSNGESCPQDTKEYKLNPYDCPSLITINKYEN